MQIAIAITKRVLFRGVQQEFSNVYHYDLETAVTAPWQTLVDEIVAVERDLHSLDVTFVRARGWTSGGNPEQNEMEHQSDLSGTGAQSINTSMDRERAVLIRWPAGKDIRGKPVYLRKWYHSCGNAAGQSFITADLANTAEISTAKRTAIAAKADELRDIGSLSAWHLVAASGRPALEAAQCHRYLEHHQLGDAWR